jgi:hypothetical protein
VFLSAVLTQRAGAQTGTACQGGDVLVSADLQRIEAVFAAEQRRARAWWYGWLAYAVVEGVVGGVAYARAQKRLEKDLWLVTWVGSAALAVELLAFPMVSAYAGTRLKRMPRATPAQRCRAQQKAVQLLNRAADTETEGTSLLSHLLGAAWALGTTGYLIGRNYHFEEALGSPHNRHVLAASALELGWTVAVTELAIWTQPMDAARARTARDNRARANRPAIDDGGLRLSVRVGWRQSVIALRF